MTVLKEMAKYVRSKNAGPFWVTIDIFCETLEAFERIKSSQNFTAEKIAQYYQVSSEHIKIFYVESLLVIKISYPRPVPQGHKYERDMHSGQQYVRLLHVAV